jgi:hypothetical protein
MPTVECRASLLHLLSSTVDTTADKATVAVIFAGVTQPLWRGKAVVEESMPEWRQDLAEASDIAGLIMPMLGCVWVLVKIWDTLTRRHAKEPPDDSEPDMKP